MTNMSQLPFRFTAKEIIEQGRTTQENLDIIKTWLSDLPDHSIPAVQDEMIVIFLISCDNDIKLTQHTITMYYKCKKDAPELFNERDFEREDIAKALNTVTVSNMPVRTEENYAIHYLNIKDPSYRAFDLGPIMKLCYMLVDLSINSSNVPNGLVIVFDMNGIGLMHLTRLKLDIIRKYFEFLQEALPIQLKGIHIINTVYFFDKIMCIIKVFMKKELIEMLQLHPPDLAQEELFSLMPKNCWPEDYGGDLPSCSELHENTLKEFAEEREFWRIEQEIRSRF
ncbi:unnamed protein product [Ceutorhynchus assimilis]|uniref:CRAL-TRIO domain-containing protein n=1 Tax=Ceutorhynchus assimilis TaxID=467358 RepID=A0A9N9MT96_9CUCU|nr:unnamed protein product [Ceutorhynchus assimilis]